MRLCNAQLSRSQNNVLDKSLKESIFILSDFEPHVTKAKGTTQEIKDTLKYFCSLTEPFQEAFMKDYRLIGGTSYEYFHLAFGMECTDMTAILALPTQTGKLKFDFNALYLIFQLICVKKMHIISFKKLM